MKIDLCRAILIKTDCSTVISRKFSLLIFARHFIR